MTEQTVFTPVGQFSATWSEDPDDPVAYSGNQSAMDYVRNYIDTQMVTGNLGERLFFDSLEPAELYGFCQSVEWGIQVMPEFNDLIQYSQDDESTDMNLALDAVDDSQAFALMGEAAQLLQGLNEDADSFFPDLSRLREIIGLLGEDAAPVATSERDKQYEFNKRSLEIGDALTDNGWPATVDGYQVYREKSGVRIYGDTGDAGLNIPNWTAWSQYTIKGGKQVIHEIVKDDLSVPVSSTIAKILAVANAALPDAVPAEKDIDKFASLQGLLNGAGIPNKIYQGNIALAKGDGKYVQQYTNNKQADDRVAKIREAGFIAHVTARHPFIIIIDGLAAEPIAAEPASIVAGLNEEIDKSNKGADPDFMTAKIGSDVVVTKVDSSNWKVSIPSLIPDLTCSIWHDAQAGRYQVSPDVKNVSSHGYGLNLSIAVSWAEIYIRDVSKARELSKEADPRDKDNYSTDPEGQRIKAGVNLKKLSPFLSGAQRKVLDQNMRGEEGEYFVGLINDLWDRISGMPVTYQQDGMGDKAIVYLHYFMGSIDSYITEKDKEGDGTEQAFGFQDLGYGGELGYINIAELVSNRMELDLYWTPKTLGAVKNGGKEPAPSEEAGDATDGANRIVAAVNATDGAALTSALPDGGIEFTLPGFKYPLMAKWSDGEYVIYWGYNGSASRRDASISALIKWVADNGKEPTVADVEGEDGGNFDNYEARKQAERDALVAGWIDVQPDRVMASDIAHTDADHIYTDVKNKYRGITAEMAENMITSAVAEGVIDTQVAKVLSKAVDEAVAAIGKAPLTSEVTENPEMTEGKKYLQSVIDGSADMLDPEVPEKFNALYEKFTGDAGFDELMNRAVEAYTNFAMGESSRAMA